MAEWNLIRGGAGFHGKQGLEYFSGVSAESTGAKAIDFRARRNGRGRGPKLEHVMRVEAGDFLYIPAGVPHQPYNPTARRSAPSSRAPTPTSRKASSCWRYGDDLRSA